MTLEQTEIFRELEQQCREGKTGSFDPYTLIAVTKRATALLGDILNRSCMNFEDYTLHDANHALRVVVLMGRIIAPEVRSSLNVVELVLLILAAYGHDVGM